MSLFEQQIPCPICNTRIPFDTKQLIAGVQFSCPHCQSSIGLACESKTVVEKTMGQFEKLKLSTSK